jgi:hypothetical protein
MSAARVVPATANAEPFFKLEATYTVNAGATLPELVRDGHSLVSSALGVLSAMEVADDGLWAVVHLLHQAVAVIGLADALGEQLAAVAKNGGAA